MNIRLNNRAEAFPEATQMTVSELLVEKKFTFKFLVVRVNGQAIRPDSYDSQLISDGDEVMVLHLISGG
jgi:thiamine biosynthesis protein ThiS